MNGIFTYLQNNGTKVLGALIGVLGIIVNTSDIVPQTWLKYIILVIAVLTYLRGQGNTQAIATAVVQQHADAIATSVATGSTPVLAPAGKLSSGGFAAVKILVMLAVLSAIAIAATGCASLGLVAPQGPQQSIAYGYSAVTAALNTLAQLTMQGGISSGDAMKANAAILSAKTILDDANAAAQSSAPAAVTLVTSATAALAQVSLYLTCKQQKGATCQL